MLKEIENLIRNSFAGMSLPSEDEVCTSNDNEALDDCAIFVGREWNDVDGDAIAEHQDALFWFTPKSFHYYMPAFMIAGLKEPDAYYILNILLMLRPDVEASDACFARERWMLFNSAQRTSLKKWLVWIYAEMDRGDDTELEDALKVLQEQYWWR